MLGESAIVLGIDPGSHCTGWGCIRRSGSNAAYIACGTVRPEGDTLAERLRHLADAVDRLLVELRPTAVSIEQVFHAKNSQSALKLGHARGVLLLSAARFGASVHEYAAREIKKAVTGYGQASKEQVQHMVRLLLGYQGPMALDASDALAIALCHNLVTSSRAAAFLRPTPSPAPRGP